MNAHVIGRPLVLLSDEDCGVCVASAAWLAARVPASRLRPLPLQAIASDPAIARAVEGRDLASTLHVVLPDGSVRTGAAAVIATARLVPRWGILALPYDHAAGHALLEPLYRLVAANRHRIGATLGLPAACRVPRAS